MNDIDKSMATGLSDFEKHILETQQLLMVRGKVTFSIFKKCHIRLQIVGLKGTTMCPKINPSEIKDVHCI